MAAVQAAMDEAARAVLGGAEVGTEAAVIRWPDRYTDPRGEVMWAKVNGLLTR